MSADKTPLAKPVPEHAPLPLSGQSDESAAAHAKAVALSEQTGAFLRNHAYLPRPSNTGPAPSFVIPTLGEQTVPNQWVAPPFSNGIRTMMTPMYRYDDLIQPPEMVEVAGPRKMLFFDPEKTTAAIVTCGGLCPGLNNVIRHLVLTMHYTYHVKKVLGFRFGYAGVAGLHEPVELLPSAVGDVHRHGGSMLGTSRGSQRADKMVDNLVRLGVDILFAVGGDGTLSGAQYLVDEITRRGLKIGVVGIPKTIDNDICYVDATFGFNTAVARSMDAIWAVHDEARSAVGGIGLVKLMGRDAGFIALHSCLSNGDVNLVLIPEVRFDLQRVLDYVEYRLAHNGHCVIVVAEGAGQHLIKGEPDRFDASGNRLQKDIGHFLSAKIQEFLKGRGIPHTLKYVDPSYMIRAAPADPFDSLLCMCLATNAVHAALAGKTGMVICHHHNTFINVPIARAIHYIKRVNPAGPLYQIMLENTGMPADIEGRNAPSPQPTL